MLGSFYVSYVLVLLSEVTVHDDMVSPAASQQKGRESIPAMF